MSSCLCTFVLCACYLMNSLSCLVQKFCSFGACYWSKTILSHFLTALLFFVQLYFNPATVKMLSNLKVSICLQLLLTLSELSTSRENSTVVLEPQLKCTEIEIWKDLLQVLNIPHMSSGFSGRYTVLLVSLWMVVNCLVLIFFGISECPGQLYLG